MTARSHRHSIAGRPARARRLLDAEAFETFAASDGELEAACCSVWFVSRSAEHEARCAAGPFRGSAA
ncbi:hypothetical protein OKJ48_15265 [Streptomyces kunmingensis]|uniref:Uncharacterized protein n=1 Tax=Streptomyces kunmingensis TaxID=68225 RepID=A0ABU6CA57_9ACTN|nr:hypothetical protein [Streptomyces kunmingensis]MEB3961598.1 hypothetical protein [Streptomyces kunmingensis]